MKSGELREFGEIFLNDGGIVLQEEVVEVFGNEGGKRRESHRLVVEVER